MTITNLGITGGFVGPYVMGFVEDATGSKFNGLWFVAAMCTIGALLTLRLKMTTQVPAVGTIAPH